MILKANDPEYYNLIKEIAKKREGIKVAQEVLTTISQDEHERARYRSRRIWEQDRECERVLRERENALREQEMQEMALREQKITFNEQEMALREQKITFNEQEMALREQDIALKEQDIALKKQEIALREQEVALKEQEKIMSITKNLLTTSMSIDEIITATGLTREEVEKLH